MHSQCTKGRCSSISIQYHTQFCMHLRTAWAILHYLKGKKYCNILLELLFLFVVFNSITTMQISLLYFISVLNIIYYPTYTLPLPFKHCLFSWQTVEYYFYPNPLHSLVNSSLNEMRWGELFWSPLKINKTKVIWVFFSWGLEKFTLFLL